MTLPADVQENGKAIVWSGIPVALLTGDLKCRKILWRAPDSGGSPDLANDEAIASLPPGPEMYFDPLPLTGATFWYRFYHERVGHDDSGWTEWASGVPRELTELQRARLRVPDYPATTISLSDVVGKPEKIELSLRADPDHGDNVLKYDELADGGAVMPPGDAAYSTYSAPVELDRDASNVKKVAAYAELNGIIGRITIAEIAPDLRPQIISITVNVDTDGDVTAQIQGDADSGSIKAAASNSAHPNLATVQAASAIDGRNVTTGDLLNIKFGETVYISAVAYSRASAAGEEGPLAEATYTWTPNKLIDPEGAENAVLNGTFEEGHAYWAPNNSDRWSIETGSPLEGDKSLKLSPQSTAGGGENIALSQVYWPKDSATNSRLQAHRVLIRTEPGEIWRIQATGKKVAAAVNPGIGFQELDDSKTSISNTYGVVSFSSASTETKSAQYTVPAGIYYITIQILQNCHATVAGESYIDGIFLHRVKRVQDLDDEFVGDDGNLDPGVGMDDGAIIRHVEREWKEEGGTAGEFDVTFLTAYQNAPVISWGRQEYISYNDSLSGDQTVRKSFLDVSTSGFTGLVENVTPGTLTARQYDFATGNSITVVGNTEEVNLGVAPDDPEGFTISFDLSVTATPDPGEKLTATLTWAIDTNDGGGWVERKTGTIVAVGIGGSPNTNTDDDHQEVIEVSGMGLNDDVRLRMKALTASGKGVASGSIHGHNLATDGDTYYGVVYYTAAGETTESAIPTANQHGMEYIAQEVSPS
jgi:hypothetical protein